MWATIQNPPKIISQLSQPQMAFIGWINPLTQCTQEENQSVLSRVSAFPFNQECNQSIHPRCRAGSVWHTVAPGLQLGVCKCSVQLTAISKWTAIQ
jgi:hypothetical protein